MASIGSTFTAPTTQPGITKFLVSSTLSQPGVDDVDTLSATVPVGKTWKIYAVKLDSGVQCRCKIYQDTDLIGSLRTGAAKPYGVFEFKNPYTLAAGEELSILVDYTDGFPVKAVGCYVDLIEL